MMSCNIYALTDLLMCMLNVCVQFGSLLGHIQPSVAIPPHPASIFQTLSHSNYLITNLEFTVNRAI